jgi:uncharacterized protein (TIGR00369 family)
LELQDGEGFCFACGPNNPIGLKLKFAFEDGKYVARFTPRIEHQGFAGVTHGGIISTALDEAMAKLLCEKGYLAVTADLHVRLRKIVPPGEELTVSGWIVSESRKIIECAAEARNSKGELVAEATGRMVKV